MRKHCSKSGESWRQEGSETPEHIAGAVERSIREMFVVNAEIEERLAEIRGCPEACGDGMVTLENLSFGKTVKAPCPVISADCCYGVKMERGLDGFISCVMRRMEVPLRHLENYDRMTPSEASASVPQWGGKGFLVILGVSGAGKSFSAALALREYLKGRVKNHFDRASWEGAERAANAVVWRSASEIADDRENAANAKRAYFAVIDDIGGENETPTAAGIIRGIVTKRHDMMLPTVITTTLTMIDLDLRYGRKVSNRLMENLKTGGLIVNCVNTSRFGSLPTLTPHRGEHPHCDGS